MFAYIGENCTMVHIGKNIENLVSLYTFLAITLRDILDHWENLFHSLYIIYERNINNWIWLIRFKSIIIIIGYNFSLISIIWTKINQRINGTCFWEIPNLVLNKNTYAEKYQYLTRLSQPFIFYLKHKLVRVQ